MLAKTLKQTHKTEWYAWRNMKARCYNENLPNYRHYGGRGIKVCDEWLGKEGFENFIASMGLRPGPQYSLDRVDNDGDYTPTNCRWATQKQQSNNQRKNILLTHNGKTLTLAEWAEQTGMNYEQIRTRYRLGWDAKSIIETAKSKHHTDRKHTSNSRLLTYNGETLDVTQWARKLGVNPEVLRSRVKYGWSTERVLTTPAKKLSTD